MIEIFCIEKYHRTHDQFMNTPKEIIDLLIAKWGSDAKAQKKKRFNSKR